MKSKSLIIITVVVLSFSPKVCISQKPDLNTASSFALFTSIGAFTNTGASVVYGDIGTHAGAMTGFPPGIVVNGVIYLDTNPYLATVASNLGSAYADLFSRTPTAGISVLIGNGQILTPGVYSNGAAVTLNGTLTLDAQNDSDALFIIKIDGAFSTNTSSNVMLVNKASICNVYWQVTAAVTLGSNSIFKGNIVSGGAIELLEGSSLHGRGLTTAGKIILHNNVVNFLPVAPGTIIGTASVCQGETGVIFTIPSISDASSYIWALTPGATITSGANTESITVSFSNTSSSGNITVYGMNGCGNGITSSDFPVIVNPLPNTSLIYHY